MTRKADDGDLERFAEAVADETPVNWNTALEETRDLERPLRGLESLARIAAAYRDSGRSYDESASPPPGGTWAGASAPAPEMLFAWGPLQVLERLGAGAYGEVYRAHDPRLQRDVALKLLRPRDADGESPEAARRFLEEGRRLARVNHPNVVTVHGADEHDGRVGLWSELLSGRTLEERLANDGVLSAPDAVVVGTALCRALAAIHGAGLVHGDVKASNVMRDAGGEIVLVDFGSGREFAPDGNVAATDRAPTGTPLSMAPEVLRGGAPDPRADLYALGVLLYRLVSNRYPVPAQTFGDLMARHERGESIPLRDVRADLPAEFVRVVERALASDPSARFGSAGEMERALASCLDVSAPAAKIVPGPSEHRTFPFGRMTLALAATLAVAILGWKLFAGGPAGTLRLDATLYAATEDGTRTLRSGDAVAPGDRLSLEVETKEPVHVYVIDEDENGEMYVLFPVEGLAQQNPLPPGRHRLPGDLGGISQDWEVTSAGGRETILVVSSREALPPIERELASIPSAQPGVLLAYAELPAEALDGLRGIAGMKPSREQETSSGRLADIAKGFRAASDARDLWLREIELRNP
ncbi:MAG: protein kinase [Gemmatimonadetes bacterium]|nr:protein kinase [Gemmatimonadota bacterium]